MFIDIKESEAVNLGPTLIHVYLFADLFGVFRKYFYCIFWQRYILCGQSLLKPTLYQLINIMKVGKLHRIRF